MGSSCQTMTIMPIHCSLTIDSLSTGQFGSLDYGTTMRWVIPGVTLTALGFQTVTSSFFVSILRMARR